MKNLQMKWHIPSSQEKEFAQEVLRTFLLPQLQKVNDYVKEEDDADMTPTMTRWAGLWTEGGAMCNVGGAMGRVRSNVGGAIGRVRSCVQCGRGYGHREELCAMWAGLWTEGGAMCNVGGAMGRVRSYVGGAMGRGRSYGQREELCGWGYGQSEEQCGRGYGQREELCAIWAGLWTEGGAMCNVGGAMGRGRSCVQCGRGYGQSEELCGRGYGQKEELRAIWAGHRERWMGYLTRGELWSVCLVS